MRLIVGLGNPGREYEKTRHNIGFRCVDRLARENGLTFRRNLKVRGAVAKGLIASQPCVLLKPSTFMNLSGESVALATNAFGVKVESLLVIVDDVALPFGQLRLKVNSGPGGHNGLKSIEAALQTQSYARLKIGVGDAYEGELSDHVLDRFTSEEEALVSEILERATAATVVWIEKEITRAMEAVNKGSIDSKHR